MFERWIRRATRREDDGPTIGFVGIHAGRRTDQPVSQNETLARLFAESGYRVRRSSAMKHPALRTAHQILSILCWRKVDLLVVAVFSGRSFWIAELATRLGQLTGKRLVLFLHGGNLPVFGPEHRTWVERVLTRADLVLAPSDFLATTFREWGLDVHVIPNVLDIEKYHYEPRTAARPSILWMRTFHEHYAPEMAVRVLASVSEKFPTCTMTMAGADQGLLQQTKAEASRLGLEDRIDFPGYILLDQKRAMLAAHDIYLNTNIVDNMPVSLLEAAASGLVPVATAVGGIPALVDDGRNGVLVASGDVEAMSSEVVRLLSDDLRFAELSRGARALAEQSSWTQVLARWEDELTLLLPRWQRR